MKTKALLSASVLLLVVAIVLYLRSGSRLTVTADPPSMLREIQRLNELVTVKYSVQKVVGIEEQKVPLGTEKILLIVQAKVLAGIDLSKLRERDIVSLKPGELLVRLPPARILHVMVDEKATKVWDRQVTWWTPWVPFNKDLEQKARLAAVESIEQSALEMGILGDAELSAITSIRRLLQAAGIPKVSFTTGS